MRIGLLGDVMLGRSVGEVVASSDPAEVWADELRELLGSLDLVVCNLECCLSGRGQPTTLIRGKPFFFRGPPQAVTALKAIGVRVAGVANNHLLDFGEPAGRDTLDLLAAQGIASAGAAPDVNAARRLAIADCAGEAVGVIAVTDHPDEYAATVNRFGTAYASFRDGVPPWFLEAVAAARSRCAVLIVFPHWGTNMTSAPAEWQRAAARELREAGADIVAGHSAHVFHGIGWVEDRPVIYDLGDALDDYITHPKLRNDRGILAIWTPTAGTEQLELVGLQLEYCRTRLAKGEEADWIASRLDEACADQGTRLERIDTQRFLVRPT
jgi:poly-gamma-glutamate capsule biosynthesis protein CapA/YwtB (metallophosphatase superfamily)